MQIGNNFWDKLNAAEQAHEKMLKVVGEIIEMYIHKTEQREVYVTCVKTHVKNTHEKIFYAIYEEDVVPGACFITENQLKEAGFEV